MNRSKLLAGVFALAAVVAFSAPLFSKPATLAVVGESHVHVAHSNRRQPLVVDFVLKNYSREPITIDAVKSGCSCVTSDMDGTVVPPKGEATVSVTVNTFDAYAAEFSQQAMVRFADESLKLTISGSLPPSDKILYRPHRLVMKAASDQRSAAVVARIPRHCGTGIDLEDVKVTGLAQSEVKIEPLDSGDLYRDYRIVVSSSETAPAKAELTITTPCEEVLVPIVVDP